jgi:hypothetical protein
MLSDIKASESNAQYKVIPTKVLLALGLPLQLQFHDGWFKHVVLSTHSLPFVTSFTT